MSTITSPELLHRRSLRHAALMQGLKLTKSRTADAYWLIRETRNGPLLTREIVAGDPEHGMSLEKAEELIRSGRLAEERQLTKTG